MPLIYGRSSITNLAIPGDLSRLAADLAIFSKITF